jgi:hypothetical protein
MKANGTNCSALQRRHRDATSAETAFVKCFTCLQPVHLQDSVRCSRESASKTSAAGGLLLPRVLQRESATQGVMESSGPALRMVKV